MFGSKKDPNEQIFKDACKAYKKEDYNKAAELFSDAAALGHVGAMSDLGLMYAQGKGVPRIKQEAVKWWAKAAEGGEVKAQHNLATAYATGDGIQQSYEDAIVWFRKSAEQGYYKSQYSLYKIYSQGLGVQKDEVKAAEWLIKAAEQMYPKAELELGRLYISGDGVEASEKLAVKYLKRAARHGEESAVEVLKDIRGDLPPFSPHGGYALRYIRLVEVPHLLHEGVHLDAGGRPHPYGGGLFQTASEKVRYDHILPSPQRRRDYLVDGITHASPLADEDGAALLPFGTERRIRQPDLPLLRRVPLRGASPVRLVVDLHDGSICVRLVNQWYAAK